MIETRIGLHRDLTPLTSSHATKQVRTRLRAWELQREREEELLGARGLWEAVGEMEDLGDPEPGLGEEEGESEEGEEEKESGVEGGDSDTY